MRTSTDAAVPGPGADDDEDEAESAEQGEGAEDRPGTGRKFAIGDKWIGRHEKFAVGKYAWVHPSLNNIAIAHVENPWYNMQGWRERDSILHWDRYMPVLPGTQEEFHDM